MRNEFTKIFTGLAEGFDKSVRESAQRAVARWRLAENRRLFADVESFAMFVGNPRTGSTLVGALLDAHPRVVVANELDALRFVRRGCSREMLYSLIIEKNRRFVRGGKIGGQYAEDGRPRAGNYRYDVPSGYQGLSSSPAVIGDKKAGSTTTILGSQPDVLDRLKEITGIPIKLIHIIRNPFDVISTRSLIEREPLEDSIASHFARFEVVMRLEQDSIHDPQIDVMHLRQEYLISSPSEALRDLLGFLHQDATEEYLRSCQGLIFDSPRRSRSQVKWPSHLVDQVAKEIEQHDLLSGYQFAH